MPDLVRGFFLLKIVINIFIFCQNKIDCEIFFNFKAVLEFCVVRFVLHDK